MPGPYATQCATPAMRDHVLLIVRAWACDQSAASSEYAMQRAIERTDDRGIVRRSCRMHDHQILQRVAEVGVSRRTDSSNAAISAFATSNPSSSRNRRSNTARHRSATQGVWIPCTGWPPFDPVDIERSPARAGRHDRHRRGSRGQPRQQLSPHAREQHVHVIDRTHAMEGHAAVCDPPFRLDCEPVHAAMSDADAIDVERLGDDDEVSALLAETTVLGQPGDACKSAALLVDGATDLDGAVQLDSRTTDGLGGEDRGGKARLHIARSATPDPAVAHLAAKRIDRPAVAGRHDIEVAVEMHDRPIAPPPPRSDDVDARVGAGVLGTSLSRVVFDLEPTGAQRRANQSCAVVCTARLAGSPSECGSCPP